MPRYLIASPHAPDECLRALEEVLARGQEELACYGWGCADGDHAGYAVVEAGSRAAVEATVPPFLRRATRIVALTTLTPAGVGELRQAPSPRRVDPA